MRTGGDEYRLQKPWSELVSWAQEELSLRPLLCQIQRPTIGLYVGGLESENDHQKIAGEHSLEQLRSHDEGGLERDLAVTASDEIVGREGQRGRRDRSRRLWSLTG